MKSFSLDLCAQKSISERCQNGLLVRDRVVGFSFFLIHHFIDTLLQYRPT